MQRIALLFLALAILPTAGCGDNDDQGPWDPIATGGCGLAEYHWLRPGEVGELVSHEGGSPSSPSSLDVLVAALTGAFSPLPYGARMYKVRYTTQDKGQPVEATGMIVLPWLQEDVVGPVPLVLLLHGTSGVTNKCAPSIGDSTYTALAFLLASQGFAVAAPDFIGLDATGSWDGRPTVTHAYLGIEQTAVGSLDLVRATHRFFEEVVTDPIELTDELIVWGVSQGGHGVLAVDLVAPYYAPELPILAGVAMVPATDLLAVGRFATREKHWISAAFAAMVTSLHHWYEGTASDGAVFTDTAPGLIASTLPVELYETCELGDLLEDATSIEGAYQSDFVDALQTDDQDAFAPWSCYLRENSIRTAPFPRLTDTPIFYVIGELDDTINTPDQQAEFTALCADGYRLDYLECADADHGDAAAWSLPEQVAWAKDRLAGVPLSASVCQSAAPMRCVGQE
ncbi:MAG: lipase family protein [bacterium]